MGPERTAALAAWIQGLYDGEPPILVGGAATELYTGGAYTTGDLDFVGHIPLAVEKRLRSAGFSKEGRHWVHPDGVFVEFPGSQIEPYEQIRRLRTATVTVVSLSPEDVIVDRLAHWEFWGSTIDAINALTIWRLWREELDRGRLRRAAGNREVTGALRALEVFSERLGDREPDQEELEEWAKPRQR